MQPVVLESHRLYLDTPTRADVDRIAEYCRDPIFEEFMTLPWPYKPSDAAFFIDNVVGPGWESERELTWAIRESSHAPLLGVVGVRMPADDDPCDVADRPPRSRGYRAPTDFPDLGYWLGRPHRGRRYMSEAVRAVCDWVFSSDGPATEAIRWECVVGNRASARVARNAGFAFIGQGPTRLNFRDGSHPDSWHGILRKGSVVAGDSGWPT